MSSLSKIVLSELEPVVSSSFSLRQVLNSLGYKAAGGNYNSLKQRIKELEIDTSHFLGQGNYRPTKRDKYRIPLEDILVKDSSYQTNKLRKRLLRSGTFEHQCNRCKNTEWEGSQIPLELEHKNGNSRDHRIENLELLCPNCHALTSTYRGKNIQYH